MLLDDQGIELTERQAQVLVLLVQGKPNKIISRELGLAPGTVKIHVTAILRKLKVSNRTQAALAASRSHALARGGALTAGIAFTP
ncbi:MAG TPA: LuxR C-terminal-related transcriptional regulator [Burkholderiales bacterium]|nr:LuxR C-terminal-related transcriptional regulator [Burkholderiales bacterium]